MSIEDDKILEKLKAKKIDKLEEKLDHNIRGYDHLIDYKDDHKCGLRSDWVDENLQIIIEQHNIEMHLIHLSSTARGRAERSSGCFKAGWHLLICGVMQIKHWRC